MNYYYLVTSLPDLFFGMDKIPLTREELELRVSAAVSPEDLTLLEIIKLPVPERFSAVHTNHFMHSYFDFERNLRNVLTGINFKKTHRDYYAKIAGTDDFITDALRHSKAPDFGLQKELPYIATIVELISQKDLYNLELFIDTLRFNTINDLTAFDYFSVEQVLGYALKYEIVERWINLNEQKGQEKLTLLSGKNIGKKELYEIIA